MLMLDAQKVALSSSIMLPKKDISGLNAYFLDA